MEKRASSTIFYFLYISNMKKLLFVLVVSSLLLVGCKKKGCTDPSATNYDSSAEKDDGSCVFIYNSGNGVMDIDGNLYETVIIGDQEWMAENLKTTRYSNGDAIPLKVDSINWINFSDAYCVYDNNYENINNYGNLYNGFSVSDSRGVCPTGWHVPTDSEFTTLSNYLGGENIAGGKLKSICYWVNPVSISDNSHNGNNQSGFNGFPGGGRVYNTSFYGFGNTGYWWTSSVNLLNNIINRQLRGESESIYSGSADKRLGLSVRCIKD